MAFTPITVSERYLYDDLTPAAGRITFTPVVPMHNGSTVIAAGRGFALDAEGDLYAVLAATDDPDTTPVGVSYEVRLELAGQPLRRLYLRVPHDAADGAIDLGSQLTAEVPPVVSYPAPGPQGPAGDTGPQGEPGPALIPATTQAGTAYTLVLDDSGTAVECTAGTAVAVTVPPQTDVAWPAGAVVELLQAGDGQVSVVEGAGVTVHTAGTLTTRTRWSALSLRRRGADEWVLSGDTA